MNVIDVSDLCKSYGPTTILDGATFALGESEKVGIVGRNGCGKSTLFRILAGLEDADAGRVVKKRGLTLSYLPQRPSLDPSATVREVLESHLGEAREKLCRHEALADALRAAPSGGTEIEALLAEQHEVHAWLDQHGAWTLDYRVEEICTRFSIPDPEIRISFLSGGWSQRVALAGILLGQPDVLLLDEPTNQLDAETIEWLEAHLAGYPGAVLLVTHDRYFLDRVVTRMLELEAGRVTAYDGGYSAYLEQKAERLALEERAQTRLLNLLRREEAWLARGAKARSTKQKARIDRVEELRVHKASGPRRELSLRLASERSLGGTVLEGSGLTVEIGGKTLVRGLDFCLRKGERVGILGPNGCGKTTLVRVLLGEVAPAAGTVTVGKHTRVGYLDQARSGLDDALPVADTVGEGDWVAVGGPAGERRHKVGYLEDFLFSREDQRKPVSTLSGGERARLLLARLLLQGANVLVLDEPTNDLDLPTLQVLDEALAEFPGCLLMVTHDRYFLDRVATGILHFEEKSQVVFYEGNYEVFTRLRAQARDETRTTGRKRTEKAEVKSRPKDPAALTYRERQQLEDLEREIEHLEGRKREVEALLADASGLAGGHRELQELSEEFTALEARLDTLLARWEELEARR